MTIGAAFLIGFSCGCFLMVGLYERGLRKRRLAEASRLRRLEYQREDCRYGFNGSVIFHFEQAFARNEPVANIDAYYRIKAHCSEIGAGPPPRLP